MVTNESTFCSQLSFVKSLANAKNMSAATLTVDNWLDNWQSLTIKHKSDILILMSQRTQKWVGMNRNALK